MFSFLHIFLHFSCIVFGRFHLLCWLYLDFCKLSGVTNGVRYVPLGANITLVATFICPPHKFANLCVWRYKDEKSVSHLATLLIPFKKSSLRHYEYSPHFDLEATFNLSMSTLTIRHVPMLLDNTTVDAILKTGGNQRFKDYSTVATIFILTGITIFTFALTSQRKIAAKLPSSAKTVENTDEWSTMWEWFPPTLCMGKRVVGVLKNQQKPKNPLLFHPTVAMMKYFRCFILSILHEMQILLHSSMRLSTRIYIQL